MAMVGQDLWDFSGAWTGSLWESVSISFRILWLHIIKAICFFDLEFVFDPPYTIACPFVRTFRLTSHHIVR